MVANDLLMQQFRTNQQPWHWVSYFGIIKQDLQKGQHTTQFHINHTVKMKHLKMSLLLTVTFWNKYAQDLYVQISGHDCLFPFGQISIKSGLVSNITAYWIIKRCLQAHMRKNECYLAWDMLLLWFLRHKQCLRLLWLNKQKYFDSFVN